MNQHKQSSDLDLGRGWLTRAAAALEAWQSRVAPQSSAALLDSPEFARAAAEIGAGFIALAHAERAAVTSAALGAAAERVRRAAAEARPHDEPCACCASGIVPVFEGPKCVRGLGPDGCGHTHEEHAGYDRG